MTVEVRPDYHPKLIGRRGEVINKLRSDHDAFICQKETVKTRVGLQYSVTRKAVN